MTSSIKTVLCLKKIPQLLRIGIPALIPKKTPQSQPPRDRPKQDTYLNALLREENKVAVLSEPGTGLFKGYTIASGIEVELNIPKTLTGHTAAHGTSVFAEGIAAFHLQRNWLAEAGVPREQLDFLETSDITLSEVSITFVRTFSYEEQAALFIEDIAETGEALYGKRCTTTESGSDRSVTLPGHGFSVTASIQTDFKRRDWPDDAPMGSLCEASPYQVRIEAKLQEPFLKERLLTSVDDWRHAYEESLYETIFNATVRKTLRLDRDVALRSKAPGDGVFRRLTPDEGEVLRGYLAKPALDPRQSQTVVSNSNQGKRFNELRKSILKHTSIDIDIPWKQHVKLRCFDLDGIVLYPGDFSPTDENAPWTFCASNWGHLQEQLNLAYEAALQLHLPQNVDEGGQY